eukprot:Gb_36603 [translate_table: standard]
MNPRYRAVFVQLHVRTLMRKVFFPSSCCLANTGYVVARFSVFDPSGYGHPDPIPIFKMPVSKGKRNKVIGDVVEDEALHKALLDSQYFVCKVRNPSPTEDAHPAQDDIPSYVGGIEKRESNVGFVNWFKRLSEGTLHEDVVLSTATTVVMNYRLDLLDRQNNSLLALHWKLKEANCLRSVALGLLQFYRDETNEKDAVNLMKSAPLQ